MLSWKMYTKEIIFFSISCLANIRLTYRKWEIENGTMILSHKKGQRLNYILLHFLENRMLFFFLSYKKLVYLYSRSVSHYFEPLRNSESFSITLKIQVNCLLYFESVEWIFFCYFILNKKNFTSFTLSYNYFHASISLSASSLELFV